jgi:hypothetical protein
MTIDREGAVEDRHGLRGTPLSRVEPAELHVGERIARVVAQDRLDLILGVREIAAAPVDRGKLQPQRSADWRMDREPDAAQRFGGTTDTHPCENDHRAPRIR